MTTQDIWSIYANDIRQFISSRVKNDDITNDILQDSFIKIHTKHHTIKDRSKLKSWLFSVVRHTIIDYYNDKQITFNPSEIELETEITLQEHTQIDCLRGIIKNLPKKYRTPLFLADIKGLKQHEIAQRLGQKLSTTKSQIQRGRKLITKGFMDCCGFSLDDKGKLIGEIQDKKDCKICN